MLLKTMFANNTVTANTSTTTAGYQLLDEFTNVGESTGFPNPDDLLLNQCHISNTIHDFSTFITDSFDLSLLPPPTLPTATGSQSLSTTSTATANANATTGSMMMATGLPVPKIPEIMIIGSSSDDDGDDEVAMPTRTTTTVVTDGPNNNDNYLLSPCYYNVSSPDNTYSNLSSPGSYCGSTSSNGSSLANIFDEVQIFGDMFATDESDVTKPVPQPQSSPTPPASDHQLLRQVLKDMSFQRKHNIRTVDIDFERMDEPRDDRKRKIDPVGIKAEPQLNIGTAAPLELEPMLSLAMQQMKDDVRNTCLNLGISLDMKQWSYENTEDWLKWVIGGQSGGVGAGTPPFILPAKLRLLNGKQLMACTELELATITGNYELGSTIFAQIEIWKAATQDIRSEQEHEQQQQLQQQQQQQQQQPATNWFILVTDNQFPVQQQQQQQQQQPQHSPQSNLQPLKKTGGGANCGAAVAVTTTSNLLNGGGGGGGGSGVSGGGVQKKALKKRKGAGSGDGTAPVTVAQKQQIIEALVTSSQSDSECGKQQQLSLTVRQRSPSPLVYLQPPVQSSPTSSSSSSSLSQPTSPITSPQPSRQQNSHIHLWEFLRELLETPAQHANYIRWIDETNGVFKIEDSLGVAQLWGKRKNRPAMNYDKLSRSIRQYYKKGIMKKTEKSQRLIYQFCAPYLASYVTPVASSTTSSSTTATSSSPIL